MHNWKTVGPVIVQHYHGTRRSYESLYQALACIPGYQFDINTVNRQGKIRTQYVWSDRYRHDGDEYLIVDEYDLVVPFWKVKEVWEQVKNAPCNTYLDRWRPQRNCFEFRNGPVPYIHRRGQWRRSRRGKARLFQEFSEIQNLLHDLKRQEDYFGLPLKVRANKQKFHNFVCWDCYHGRANGDTWKRYRKTQYKTN